MDIDIKINLDLPDPERRIKGLVSLVEERDKSSAPLRDDDATIDAVLRALQGEAESEIPDRVCRMLRVWLHQTQRTRVHSLLFSGCTDVEITKALHITDVAFVETYRSVFFNTGVFTNSLEIEAYAEKCKREMMSTRSDVQRQELKALWEAFKYGQDVTLSQYTRDINFPRAVSGIARDQYVDYVKSNSVTEQQLKQKQASAAAFLKAARSLPEIKEAYRSGDQDFKTDLESRIMDRRTARARQLAAAGGVALTEDDFA